MSRGLHLLFALPLLVALLSGLPGPLAADDDPPALRGTMGQYRLLLPLTAAALTPLRHQSGEVVDLSRWRGRIVLVNFWATWCIPCVAEMPSLDALAGDFADEDFAVVALSLDVGGMADIRPFFGVLGLRNLEMIQDRDEAAWQAFAARGLPTSYLLDRQGRVLGYLEGAADWNGPEARALIRHYLDHPAGS